MVDGTLDPYQRLQEIRNLTKTESEQEQPRELNVLAPTIAVEEIDRAVVNKLMQEISNDPETTKTRLAASDAQLEDILIIISNARSFINNSEMANVRAMCNAWNRSELEDDSRIEEALNAYKRRAQFTKDFIAKYYRIVLMDIEAVLQGPSLVRFSSYMEDRRRRMASSGAITWGAVVENVTSGREAVHFHCRRN
ncbi:MAG: hypothetical protein CNF02_08855 [OM182 bacterium MED-G28]|uniref:Uncharacterized protein n=1 Tax=OM182 bacterium MED-G28 TaxID=1986256 RepID=A0A2A5WAJ6_9GAMM|nr:MAG: hypothetical protein CNF02_08855 [OM182 bacterium MED-G28]